MEGGKRLGFSLLDALEPAVAARATQGREELIYNFQD